MVRHQRIEALSSILVLSEADVLDTERLVAWVCGMADVLASRAYGQCEHSDVEYGLRERYCAG